MGGCAELNANQVTAIAIGIVVGYGLYEISKNSGANTYTPVSYYKKDDCKNLYQSFRGCCSYHGGVAGCYNYYVICNDGTISRTCRCSTSYCVAY